MSKINTDFKNRAGELILGLIIFVWAFHFLILSVLNVNPEYSILSIYLISLGVLTSANGVVYSSVYRKLILFVGYYTWIFLLSMCILTGGPTYSIYVYIFLFLFSTFLGLRINGRKVW
jgi:hypothetical protein